MSRSLSACLLALITLFALALPFRAQDPESPLPRLDGTPVPRPVIPPPDPNLETPPPREKLPIAPPVEVPPIVDRPVEKKVDEPSAPPVIVPPLLDPPPLPQLDQPRRVETPQPLPPAPPVTPPMLEPAPPGPLPKIFEAVPPNRIDAPPYVPSSRTNIDQPLMDQPPTVVPPPPKKFEPPLPKLIEKPPTAPIPKPLPRTSSSSPQVVAPPFVPAPVPAAPLASTPMEVTEYVPHIDFTTTTFERYRIWGGMDYAMWWFSKSPIAVPLAATTTSAPGPGVNILGIDPNARVVIGSGSIEQNPTNGGRLWLGGWLDSKRSVGLEVAGLWVETPLQRVGVQSDSGGLPMFSRPITIPGMGPAVYDISYPTFVGGGFNVTSDQVLRGLEGNFVGFLAGNEHFAVELLAGARLLNLDEDLHLNYQMTNLLPMPAFKSAVLPAGTTSQVVDRYHTINQFYGGQVGARIEQNFGRLSLSLVGKVAFGVNDMTLYVDGSTVRGDTGQKYSGGMLATSANIGRYQESHYAFAPEGNLSVGWWFTPNLRLKVGYNVLYISDVIRPGSHISNTVNPSAVPLDQLYGSGLVPRTPPSLVRGDFWADGITFGIDFRY